MRISRGHALIVLIAIALCAAAAKLPRSNANAPKHVEQPAAKERCQAAIQKYDDAVNCEACGAFTDAIKIYREILENHPGYDQARYRLGWSYLATGDKDRAITEWKVVLKGKNHTDTFVQDLLEQCEKASLPSTDEKVEKAFASCLAHLDAARSLQSKVFHLTGISGLSRQEDAAARETDLWRRSRVVLNRIGALAHSAIDEQGVLEHYPAAWPLFGESWQIMVETHESGLGIEGWRQASKDWYSKYLIWIQTLGIPDTERTKQIRARYLQMRDEWKPF